MAEEFYTVPESPEYNAAAIRKIQDTDPVRASTIVNPVVQQMINNMFTLPLDPPPLYRLRPAWSVKAKRKI